VIAAVVLLLIVVGATAYVLMRCRTVYETEEETPEETKDEPGSVTFPDGHESLAEVFYENPANDSNDEPVTMLSDSDVGDATGAVVI
jgi:hypothetical protein